MLKIPPDWGTFCVLIVSFLVFWFIFKRLLFDPFLKLLADRERRLRRRASRIAPNCSSVRAGTHMSAMNVN